MQCENAAVCRATGTDWCPWCPSLSEIRTTDISIHWIQWQWQKINLCSSGASAFAVDGPANSIPTILLRGAPESVKTWYGSSRFRKRIPFPRRQRVLGAKTKFGTFHFKPQKPTACESLFASLVRKVVRHYTFRFDRELCHLESGKAGRPSLMLAIIIGAELTLTSLSRFISSSCSCTCSNAFSRSSSLLRRSSSSNSVSCSDW